MTETATKSKDFFGVAIKPDLYKMTHTPCDEPYEQPVLYKRGEKPLMQEWSGYCNESTRPADEAARLPVQTSNIKPTMRYMNAEAKGNKWMRLACEQALLSVQNGGGPFGSAIVQIDDETNRVIRYWTAWNHVTEWNDPTAHGEITGVRQVCQELGVLDLGNIKKDDPNLKLPQKCKTSHIELYTNAEPCSMCYTGMRWARISNIFFAATVFDAAQQGVNFSDEPIYCELVHDYGDRGKFALTMYQCDVDNSLDAFNHFKRSNAIKY